MTDLSKDLSIPVEELCDAIVRIADAADAIGNAGLTRRGLLVLLRDKTSLGLREIALVLDALPELREYVDKQ